MFSLVKRATKHRTVKTFYERGYFVASNRLYRNFDAIFIESYANKKGGLLDHLFIIDCQMICRRCSAHPKTFS